MRQLAFELLEPAAPSLDNFVVGRNAELVERLRELTAMRETERTWYIWGPRGSGRTHLLRAALAELQHRGLAVAYLASPALPPQDEPVEAAAVDDVELLGNDSQTAVFNLYNELRERGGFVLAAGNAPPAELPLRAEVKTRLAWGLVYEVHALTDEEKARALAQHAASRGFNLHRDVAQYLLIHVQRDMRSLVSVLDSLDRYSLETKRAVTLPLVRQMLSNNDQPVK